MTENLNKTSFKIIAYSVVSIFLIISSVFGETIQIDLNKAIDLAMSNNESYRIAKKELDRANSQVMEAASGALPTITGGLSYVRNWKVPVLVIAFDQQPSLLQIGTANTYSADLTFSQTLYSGGKTFAALKIAGLYKKLSRETVRKAGQDLKLQVYQSYYGAVLAGEIYRSSSQSLDLAMDNLDVVSKMNSQGLASEYDLLRARVEVANLKPIVTKSKTNSEVAISALKNLLGVNAGDQIELDADFDSTRFIIPPVDVSGSENELIKERPEVKMSRYTTEGRQKAISLSTSDYRPSLKFSTSLQYQAQFDQGNIFNEKWYRSLNSVLSLTIPIFDSWKTPSRVKQARIDYMQSGLQEEAVRKAMVLDLEQSYGKYQEARENLSAQGNAVELARRGLDIANVRFENGVGTQLEVADARLQLRLAENNKSTAFYDLAVSYAMLMRALGRDLEPIN